MFAFKYFFKNCLFRPAFAYIIFETAFNETMVSLATSGGESLPARNFPAVGVKEDSEMTPLLIVCFQRSSESYHGVLSELRKPSYYKILRTSIGVL